MVSARTLRFAKRGAVCFAVVAVLLLIRLLPDVEPGYDQAVVGRSMLPGIDNGENIHVLYRVFDKVTRTLGRGDIVVFQSHEKTKDDDNAWYLKRIVGLPSETVTLAGGYIYINGKLLVEKYISGAGLTTSGKWLPECSGPTLSADQYFLLGDNRQHSRDSRGLGPISLSDIIAVLPADRQTQYTKRWVLQDQDFAKTPDRLDRTSCASISRKGNEE